MVLKVFFSFSATGASRLILSPRGPDSFPWEKMTVLLKNDEIVMDIFNGWRNGTQRSTRDRYPIAEAKQADRVVSA